MLEQLTNRNIPIKLFNKKCLLTMRQLSGRDEVCGIRDQRGGIRDQKGVIWDINSPGRIRDHRPWDRDQQFLEGSGHQAAIFVGPGTRFWPMKDQKFGYKNIGPCYGPANSRLLRPCWEEGGWVMYACPPSRNQS